MVCIYAMYRHAQYLFMYSFTNVYQPNIRSFDFSQSQMETLKAAPVPDGEEPISSAQIVAKVLTDDSSMSNTFLKNAGLQSRCSSRSVSSTERELREQLEAERQAKAALQEQVDALKKKSEIADENLAKTQKQLDETTKTVEENNMLLRRLLTLNGNLP